MGITINHPLYDREYKVIAIKDGEKREYTGVRIEFKINIHGDTKLNEMDLSLTNLNEISRKFFEDSKYKCDIELQAGYKNFFGTIFKGTVEYLNDRKGDHITGFKKHHSKHNDTAWITSIKSVDGIKAVRNNIFSISINEKTDPHKIINQLVDRMNIDKGAINTKSIKKHYEKGYSSIGPTHSLLENITKSQGYNYKIQKNRIDIWKIGTPFSDETILLDIESGLIGSPERTEKGLKLKSLLRYDFEIGRLIELNSRYEKGLYIIKEIIHTGDSHGDNWESDIEVIKYER